jgi:hypothetical protein
MVSKAWVLQQRKKGMINRKLRKTEQGKSEWVDSENKDQEHFFTVLYCWKKNKKSNRCILYPYTRIQLYNKKENMLAFSRCFGSGLTESMTKNVKKTYGLNFFPFLWVILITLIWIHRPDWIRIQSGSGTLLFPDPSLLNITNLDSKR